MKSQCVLQNILLIESNKVMDTAENIFAVSITLFKKDMTLCMFVI